MLKVVPIDNDANVRSDGSYRGSARMSVIVTGALAHSPSTSNQVSLTILLRKGLRRVLHETGWYESAAAIFIRKFLIGKTFAVISLVSLLIALFFADLFVVLQVPTNVELDTILTLVFLVFAFEFFGLCIVDASYFLGFFFWMDLIGTGSILMDLSFIMSNNDATQAVQLTSNSDASDDVVVVRAARAAKLGARAGRISRLLKIMRVFSMFRKAEEAGEVRVAKTITNQLINVLSTRVAFLTICVVVVMPLFGLLQYPEMDDSMSAWANLLERNALSYLAAKASGNSTLTDKRLNTLRSEVDRLSAFYESKDYGCFDVCMGSMVGEELECSKHFGSSFHHERPERKSSIRTVTEPHIKVSFNLAQPDVEEAVSGMILVIFIIVIMSSFGLLMSKSLTVVALEPLERMLTVVRERCAEIFKYTEELQEKEGEEEEEKNEDYDDWEQDSEFVLLEKVVKKLAGIVQVTAAAREPEVKENMDEGDIVKLNWMQGTPQTVETFRKSHTQNADSQDDPYDQVLSATLNGVPLEVRESVETWDFDSLVLSKEHLSAIASWMIMTSEGSAAWVQQNVLESHVLKFMSILESKYPPNPFHNIQHAVDVTFSCYRFMRIIGAGSFLSESTQFWLLIAAVGHDVGHLGVNNQYLVECSHELALKYNDRSPLENMHCSTLFGIVGDAEANVFSKVDKDLYREMRKGIIATILHTDITFHNAMCKEMGMVYQMNSNEFDSGEAEIPVKDSQSNMQLVLNALLHGADIANPMKPWRLCEKLAHLCLDEFFAQGDLEKSSGLPVQMLNDRDKVNRPNSQIGFIEFLICPFVESMVNMFPQLDSLATNLASNIQSWSEQWLNDVSPPPDAAAKVEARVRKVAARCTAVTRDFRCL